MNTLQALVLAVGVMLAALIVGSFNRYSMTPAVDHRGILTAYRLDRLSGQVYFCAVPETGSIAPMCAPVLGSF